MPPPAAVRAALDDIGRIAGDGRLNAASRRSRIAARRALAVIDSLQPGTHELRGWTVTIGAVNLVTAGVELADVTATKNGIPAPLDPHRLYVNPPLLTPDPAGDVNLARTDPSGQDILVPHRADPAGIILGLIVAAAEAGGP